ncbi:sugar ABC transporter ATP-binding protein [Roseibium sp. SCP14]|uniref:sugar ABC transporter ATP-binding protein n=1 Tax=Roseibium sp. SCP14 TaxID=3141375 RepID=UPI00333BD798
MNENSIIEMSSIGKRFPGVTALDGVSFTCRGGEVHALVGENGAGKSTLIKILAGVYRPDSGTILLHGEPAEFRHPLEALKAGISVIYQEFSLLPDRTVTQNIFLGREMTRAGFLDNAAMRSETRRALDLFKAGRRIDPDSLVADLDVASQQMVEIAKAIALGAKVLVMDEPTAALNDAECDELFETVDALRDHGTAVIYITHRMREVARLADRITVLKDGKVAASFDSLPDPGEVVKAMVGRDIETFYAPAATPEEIGAPVLSISAGENDVLHNIDLDLHAGEILGIAGVQGAGRVALAMAIFGDRPFTAGTVNLQGAEVHVTHPREAIRAGIGLVPGDRKGEGLVLMQSVRDNGMLSPRAFADLFSSRNSNKFTNQSQMDRLLDGMEVKSASYEQDIRFLSGGNQQKVIVARWLALKPKVLIFVEPTRGIDVKAKAAIYHLMRDLARRGTGIIMISSDLPEIVGAADRVLVMREGRIVAEHRRGVGETEIMLDATGEAGAAA